MKKTQNAKQETPTQPTLPEWVATAAWVLRVFGELKWLKDIKNFILDLAVQISELLVIAALVLSMVNFLTGGALMKNMPWISDDWAWLQAVAIDAGFGVVLVSFLDNFKKDTWVQCFIYAVLTGLLGFNAGAVTYIDSLASASHLAMTDPGVNPFPLWVLSLTRAIAVVGFLGVSRIHSYDFSKLPVPSLLSLVHTVKDTAVSVPSETTSIAEVTTDVKALPEHTEKDTAEIVHSEEEDTGPQDDNATTIVTPDFKAKKRTTDKKKIVQVVPGDEVDTKIREAIKALRERDEKVNDGTVATEAGFKNRITVLRWRQRNSLQSCEQVS